MVDLVSLVVLFGIPVGVLLAKDGNPMDVLQSGLSAYLGSLAVAFWSLLTGVSMASGILGTIMTVNILLGLLIVPVLATLGYLAVALLAFYGVKMKP